MDYLSLISNDFWFELKSIDHSFTESKLKDAIK